ncbi:MAG: hypothetical protein H6704_28685 [Myxococcales bacterium]|nr:hypothetical protein [Myxococcales bacterium]
MLATSPRWTLPSSAWSAASAPVGWGDVDAAFSSADCSKAAAPSNDVVEDDDAQLALPSSCCCALFVE